MDQERIKFSIKGPDGMYRGEATGRDLRDHATFEVHLSDGERFKLEAVEEDTGRFSWKARAKENLQHIAPVIGSIIERFFGKSS